MLQAYSVVSRWGGSRVGRHHQRIAGKLPVKHAGEKGDLTLLRAEGRYSTHAAYEPTMAKNPVNPLVQAHRDGAMFPTIRDAYYVASSAVASAAINDMPDFASVARVGGRRSGRVRYMADGNPEALAVVRFSGLAGVQLLTGDNVTAELALACADAGLSVFERTARHSGRDSIEAVREILRVEPSLDGLALAKRVNVYFDATRAMVGSVWPCIQAVVDALLERQTLSRGDLMRAIGPFQIYQPAHSTLKAYGLLPTS